MRFVTNSSSVSGEMGAFSFSPSVGEPGAGWRLERSDHERGCRSTTAINSAGGVDGGHGRVWAVSTGAGIVPAEEGRDRVTRRNNADCRCKTIIS